MLRRFPKWMWAGAWMLAFLAGQVNVVGFLGFERQAVTHLTGVTSQMGIAIARGDTGMLGHLAAVAGAFVLGTVLSGFVIQDSTLRFGRRYGVALLIEAALLAVAVRFFERRSEVGPYLAACACGLQNAMASTYSGSTVRTTHVSGMYTDLGIALGHWVRGVPVDNLRVRLCAVIITAFLCGGAAGAWVFGRAGYAALYVPAGMAGAMSMGYGVWRLWAGSGWGRRDE